MCPGRRNWGPTLANVYYTELWVALLSLTLKMTQSSFPAWAAPPPPRLLILNLWGPCEQSDSNEHPQPASWAWRCPSELPRLVGRRPAGKHSEGKKDPGPGTLHLRLRLTAKLPAASPSQLSLRECSARRPPPPRCPRGSKLPPRSAPLPTVLPSGPLRAVSTA